MTIVIGIRCIDGVILASDSQFTANYRKELRGSKIFAVNKLITLGAAGSVSQMKILLQELKQKLGNTLFSDLHLKRNIEEVLLSLHKKYQY